jgi:hypothetical protein
MAMAKKINRFIHLKHLLLLAISTFLTLTMLISTNAIGIRIKHTTIKALQTERVVKKIVSEPPKKLRILKRQESLHFKESTEGKVEFNLAHEQLIDFALTLNIILRLGAAIKNNNDAATTQQKAFDIQLNGLTEIMEKASKHEKCEAYKDKPDKDKKEYYNDLQIILQQSWLAMKHCNKYDPKYGIFGAELYLVTKAKLKSCQNLPCISKEWHQLWKDEHDNFMNKVEGEKDKFKQNLNKYFDQFMTHGINADIIQQNMDDVWNDKTRVNVFDHHPLKKIAECYTAEIKEKIDLFLNAINAGKDLGEKLLNSFRHMVDVSQQVTQMLLNHKMELSPVLAHAVLLGNDLTEVAEGARNAKGEIEKLGTEIATESKTLIALADGTQKSDQFSGALNSIGAALSSVGKLNSMRAHPISTVMNYFLDIAEGQGKEEREKLEKTHWQKRMCPVFETWCRQYSKLEGSFIKETDCPTYSTKPVSPRL